jgi:protein involved in temperature-dependent protein secretion
MQELLEKLLEHAKANPGEFLTGVATLLLVVITGLLVKATRDLAVATRVLAQSAAEDSRNRRVQATADAWMNLRRELDLPHLRRDSGE